MTVPSVVNATAHGRRPIVLYKFMMAPPQPPVETPLDDMVLEELFTYADLTEMTAAGWVVNSIPCPTSPEGELRGWPTIAPGGSHMLASIANCVTVEIAIEATAELTVSGFTPGSIAWASALVESDGHWFEPLSLRLSSGGSSKSIGFNPSASGFSRDQEKTTGIVTVDSSGDITMRWRIGQGYPTIGHNDIFVVERLRLFVQASGGEGPLEQESIDYFRTSFRRSVTFQSNIYTPAEIEHTESTQGVEDQTGTIQITLPADDSIAVELRSPIPPSVPMVAIYEYHRPPVDEPDLGNVHSTLYEIISAEHEPHTTVLTCVSLLGSGNVVIPSGLVQRDYCMFQTYDAETCGVDPTAFTFTGIVADISGLDVTVTGAGAFNPDPTFFALGDFRKGIKHTLIRQQVGDVMTLDEMIPGLLIGDTVILLAGDDRTKETCHTKFQNSARRFSFPNLPVSNPYYGQGLRS